MDYDEIVKETIKKTKEQYAALVYDKSTLSEIDDLGFEFLIHFSCSFKFLSPILSFYCGFVIDFVHPCSICSSCIRFV
jgi:hypothetical protein